MAREDRNAGRRRDTFGGERANEFGGEPRFRGEGAHGSHFGGEPEALGVRETGQHRNTKTWLGERRRKFIEKFDRWRRERAALAAKRGPDSAPAGSPTGRDAGK